MEINALWIFCLIGFIGGLLFYFLTLTIPILILHKAKNFPIAKKYYLILIFLVILIILCGWIALWWPILLITSMFQEQLNADRELYSSYIILSFIIGIVINRIYIKLLS